MNIEPAIVSTRTACKVLGCHENTLRKFLKEPECELLSAGHGKWIWASVKKEVKRKTLLSYEEAAGTI